MHPRVLEVTERLIARSHDTRQRYLQLIRSAASDGPMRGKLQCANFAHGVAACGPEDKNTLRMMNAANVAIVSSYNDMLSAHQPYGRYPEAMKLYAREVGATAQVAGGVPAMCDGVTQGHDGMELSLFSRDVIALSTAVATSRAARSGSSASMRPLTRATPAIPVRASDVASSTVIPPIATIGSLVAATRRRYPATPSGSRPESFVGVGRNGPAPT